MSSPPVRSTIWAAAVLACLCAVCLDQAWADESSLEVSSESQEEFASMLANMRKTAFVDETMDADLSRSLRDNLRGAPGKAGKPGVKGLTGPMGPTGPVGPAGPVGAQGAPGRPGPRGPQGPRGLNGPKGPAGAEGPQGLTGPRGYPGAAGPKGDKGMSGPPGPVGLPGAKGFRGKGGKTGPRGYKGARGPQGFVGAPGSPGPSGRPGPTGKSGPAGATGVQGRPGAAGSKGDRGPKGPKGRQGEAGPSGKRGQRGKTGLTGAPGGPGPQGAPGRTGGAGPRGKQGPRGLKGDQGVKGPAGSTGATGPRGSRGARGMPGPQGSAGPPGKVGNPGKAGIKGPRGATGPGGPPGRRGPKGNDGSLRKYTLTGKRRFMISGGRNSNPGAKIYTGQENNGPVLFFESSKTPVSLALYQTKKRQKVASINGWYGNIGIGEKKPTAKLHVKGQILMSHNFNNVLSAKESRMDPKTKKKLKTQFDLIGTYWGMDKKAVYIGAYTGSGAAGTKAEKVIFGGTTNLKEGQASVDLLTGKVFAKGFVTTSTEYENDMMSDLEAESLLQVSADKDAEHEVDIGRSHHYLHKKVRDQAETIARLQKQLKDLTGSFKRMKMMFEQSKN